MLSTLTGAAVSEEIRSVRLETEEASVLCLPAQGNTIVELVDRASGVDALWIRRSHAPAPASRALGPAGEPSVQTFLDLFVGGWFAMFPVVGYPGSSDPTSMLHGELVRLPWEIDHVDATTLAASVRTVRAPVHVQRECSLVGPTLIVRETIANVGGEAVPYLWGQHPCLDRASFRDGTIELEVAAGEVPAPHYDPAAAILEAGDVQWPRGSTRRGAPIDLSRIPADADGRLDHLCLTPTRGRARVTAPEVQLALVLEWDPAVFPHLLVWENFRAAGGYPFWGSADTFAIEFSTNPGRSVDDALAAGPLPVLLPGDSLSTSFRARWERL